MAKLKKHKIHSPEVIARRKKRKAMLLKQGEMLKKKYGQADERPEATE